MPNGSKQIGCTGNKNKNRSEKREKTHTQRLSVIIIADYNFVISFSLFGQTNRASSVWIEVYSVVCEPTTI